MERSSPSEVSVQYRQKHSCLYHLYTIFWETQSPGTNQKKIHTFSNQRPRTQEQEIHYLLLTIDIRTNLIHYPDQTHIRFHEDILPLRIQLLQIARNPVPCLLRPPEEVDPWLQGILGELLQRGLADSASGADVDGDKVRRE